MFVSEAILMAVALSLDAFAAGFAYGSNKITIPIRSVIIITLVSSGLLGAGLYFGGFLAPIIPAGLARWVSFVILFTLGIVKIYESIMKRLNRGDCRYNNSLSIKETLLIAFALALDGAALGFGAGLGDTNPLLIIGISLIVGALAILSGGALGGKIAQKTPANLSWVAGAILFALAFGNLF
ncbi:MAG: manganese efflux pump [Defluviitaleaceae bacterium]|nr:manganese efflux pump [Defluviitaleaceae bacterium]